MDLTLERVGLRYPGADRNAVEEISLQIADGEFLVLVGPSGCGKSTTLRMLAGLELPTEGTILFGDEDVTTAPAAERDIAMVFQNYALYPHMTVEGNMEFALKNIGVPKAERRERIVEAARLLDIEPYLDRKPRQLSGGQRQRVAMGRAIVRDPQVFMMDEPLSNLDAKLRVQTRTQISQLQKRLGVTTVYVTHDQTEAMTMGDRVVVMNAGRIEQVGTPKELYSRPETLFVAGFIGSPTMNLLAGRLESDGASGRRVRVGRNLLPVPAGLEFEHDDIVVGVRPEDLDTQAHGGAEGGEHDEDRFTIDIALVESVGSDVYVYGSVHGAEDDKQLVARIDKDHEPVAGERMTLTADARRVLFFDAQTQRLIGSGAGV
ncbi:MAG: ABC transporter ATP-binding protein [Agrococcus casei]|uniref:Glycerol-3-phosphate ABC transporter, ATP-binding protein UgpC (TC 3.A.1.1.3) n=1 Tax=Agrococcus casei LMG 22410 TaxID=1255656 RepID=A0A1R4FA79_9MICO|nr:sn-glycerol-3-phosphate ABC transporter ATP-binding protein UgpC [Agrococcus casei]SJM52767.1 Glycerol-3-phosphate ABC transporter, ATP-binding protein UgpC (TC 3.A.1.1.3) [Agrococcus casei LMG 22410]